ncbi:MAG: tRNA (N(6)-L-threonylcarbamoyladenosine(37)-C(2))-methylthiotransferase MtaB [Rickettsiales bacterium]|jgi:threonylcarbamoyladenosine tRNA methylthiotransferase MtaB|nr:tRNA (N(6)-L-threonylcarbamoyladenosine(37)-C(2))-methylthiotransferase MtaB [Rickettsiales bacterium]
MVEVMNFGCRLNSYEGEVIRAQAEQAGLEGALIFNSCAVTAEAERQVKQAIRRARKENPDAKIIVTGCGAQISPKDYAAMPEVDAVIGNEEKLRAESYSLLSSRAQSRDLRSFDSANAKLGMTIEDNQKILVNDIMSVKETASHMVASFDGRARAFVQVQNGCNHRCTFCIIPYGRGNSRSVPIGEIVAQVRMLAQQGYNEIVLTGVDISDYGKDLPGEPTLGQMMRRLLALVPELKRLRLSSIDAVEVDDDLYRLIAEEPRLMPHLHISLQAGDDMVLKRMKRRHLRHDIVAFAQKVRSLRPDMVFGADIIAGFPTETDAMFENTLRLVDELQLIHLHVFPYSAREGTPAAKMPQVAKTLRKERAARLREAGEKQLAAWLKDQVGKTASVVVEKPRLARSEHFAMVELDCDLVPGSVAQVSLVAQNSQLLQGRV